MIRSPQQPEQAQVATLEQAMIETPELLVDKEEILQLIHLQLKRVPLAKEVVKIKVSLLDRVMLV